MSRFVAPRSNKPNMNITIKTIPHQKQRYPTVGDWLFDSKGDLEIRVSDTKNWKYNALVAVHELIEVLLCKERGIDQQTVDKFDKSFEKRRKAKRSPIKDSDEPGDAVNSPYRDEHCTATGVERILAAELNVSWIRYEDALASLDE